VTERRGNWLQTVGGRAFFPLDPRPEDIAIEDIAHALAFVCRFGGHCRQFYSVAEHCVRVSHAIAYSGGSRLEQLSGLLHDAAEAYIGDMVWPLKQAADLSGYKLIEQAIENAISRRFEVPFGLPIVKHYDLVLLSTEKRDLMADGQGRRVGSAREADAAREKLGAWHSDSVQPLKTRIDPWSPAVARAYFSAHFDTLGGKR
jgi:hypothetical protein